MALCHSRFRRNDIEHILYKPYFFFKNSVASVEVSNLSLLLLLLAKAVSASALSSFSSRK
ncbi:hypothetical protein BTU51_1306 [Rickettsia rickettsii]|uniref:Uncharacterized protein n=1 Tax=Rickettsia rickettsii (strain Iowa) TaxID=452659 RepID=B0BUZ0_RICRO|nr:hypothetical protein RrIowa_1306 [Rickettsia rickettsii str. Iowa]APU56000.1 hypothetical protein BTU50_1306 [Rickettsia rickettsii]APU57377.1 hypothetical protein BTU51_1306 [Rickettsia rickettsii]